MVSTISEDVEILENSNDVKIPEETPNSPQNTELSLKDTMLDFLCNQKNVFFKSQQIDDQEMTFAEKLKISNEILDKSHSTFLSRFGSFLRPDHILFFENQDYSNEEQYIVSFYLREIRQEHKNRSQNVKNRRYAALLKLIADQKYFSFPEMKEREPLLYEQLVGQYKTAAEKKFEARPNAKTDTLIDVLFQGIDRDYVKELEQQQREEESKMSVEETESMSCGNSDSTDEEDYRSRQQWGEFPGSEEAGTSKESKTDIGARKRAKKLANLVTAAERDLLKDEFLGIMYSNFLMGKDKDVDYNAIDSNTEFDDVREKIQDKEDAYFENYDSDDVENELAEIKIENSVEQMADTDGEEDELDIYMKHLEEHLKKQQQNSIEEFDDD